jgi:CarboxypepD_reg-like domain/TonB-dependent Receptor Plug Domain
LLEKNSNKGGGHYSRICLACLFAQSVVISPPIFDIMSYLTKILSTVAVSAITLQGFSQETLTGTIKGKVIDKWTKQVMPYATVVIKGTQTGAVTDSTGGFIISKVNEGVYQLTANFVGYQQRIISDLNVVRKKTTYLEIEIEQSSFALNEVTVVAYKYENNPSAPVSTYGFSREEISRNPGAQGDIFRAIGMLPGVSSSSGQYSAIAVRGQGVRDNIYMVDDIPVSEVGHMEGNGAAFNDPNGGRFSIFAPRVIDNAQFQGGGISAQYGRRSSSFLGLGIKEGNKEDFTIDGQLDLMGFTINYDGPSYIHKNTSLFVSARYQNFRELIKLVNIKGAGVPSYADFIFKSTTQFGIKNKLSVVAIASPDSYLRTIDDVKQITEIQNASLNNKTSQKYIFGLNLRTLTSKNSYWKNILYFTKSNNNIDFGISFPQVNASGNLISTENISVENHLRTIDRSETKIGYRSIYTIHFKNYSNLIAGIDLDRTELTNYRNLSRPDTSYVFGTTNFRPNPTQYFTVIDPNYFNTEFSDTKYNASAYIEYSFLLFKKLTLNVGGRYDYTGFADQHTFSPRLSGSFKLNETNSINFASGIYYQDPVYSEIADQPKDQKLKEEQITTYIVGYKKQFSPDLKLTVEGWYKSFDKMVVRPNSHYNFQTNDGSGLAAGCDINVTKRLSKNIHGQIGYSYMQSRRNDYDGLGEYNFSFSQPHQVNFLLSHKAGKHWILSTKFRYATGRPTNKLVVHSDIFNDPNYIRYSAEIIGKNLERLTDFISLDVRANYHFKINRIGFTFFVDIVNILNRPNQNDKYINIFSGKPYYDGAAIFPSFGLKFEF